MFRRKDHGSYGQIVGTSIENLINNGWNIRETNTKEIEKNHTVVIKETGKALPMGYMNREWNSFKRQMRKGDKIYWYRSPQGSWTSLAGREGFSIVRNGFIVCNLTYAVS